MSHDYKECIADFEAKFDKVVYNGGRGDGDVSSIVFTAKTTTQLKQQIKKYLLKEAERRTVKENHDTLVWETKPTGEPTFSEKGYYIDTICFTTFKRSHEPQLNILNMEL